MAMRSVISHLFDKHLLVTNTVTCGVLMGLGDIVVQSAHKLKGERKHYDYRSMCRLFVYGVSMGPAMHYWYKWLDHFIPGQSLKVTATKILPDQLIASPYFISAFFLGVGLLEGKSFKDSFSLLKENFWQVYKFDWIFWPAAQVINFSYIPTQYRVLYVCLCTLIWDVYLVYVKHKDERHEMTTSTLEDNNNNEKPSLSIPPKSKNL